MALQTGIPSGFYLLRAASGCDVSLTLRCNDSRDWETILQETIAKLTKDGQTTIANEVQNAFNRGIGTAGVEFRCDADFV